MFLQPQKGLGQPGQGYTSPSRPCWLFKQMFFHLIPHSGTLLISQSSCPAQGLIDFNNSLINLGWTQLQLLLTAQLSRQTPLDLTNSSLGSGFCRPMAGETPHQKHQADSHLPAGRGKGELSVRERLFPFSPPGKTPEPADSSSAAPTQTPPQFHCLGFWQGHPSISRQSCFQIALIPSTSAPFQLPILGAKASNFCSKLLEQHPGLSTFFPQADL